MGTMTVVSIQLPQLKLISPHTSSIRSSSEGFQEFEGSFSISEKLNVSSRSGRVSRRGFFACLIAVGIGPCHHGEAGVASAAADAPEIGLREGRLRGCDGSAPCVSTSAFQSPSRFMPPWTYLGAQEDAYTALKKGFNANGEGAKVVNEDGRRYLYAILSSTSSRDDVDDLEFLFSVGFMSEDSGSPILLVAWLYQRYASVPILAPSEVKGPRNRGRLERLRDDLGWMPLETDEDKRWVPLLLH